MNQSSLKKIRIILALLFFVGITLIFLDFTGTVHRWLGWMTKVQFMPSVLALNVGVIIALAVITLVFGRIYCSVICPLGVMQDISSWLSGKRKKKKYRFSYSPALKWLRYGTLVLFILAVCCGIGSFVALLAPYSSYGRIAQNIFAPVWQWCNNFLAYISERADSYAFYEKEVWIRSLPVFVIASTTFVALVVIAWRSGRTYCNTICPVGTILGFLSRYSWLKPSIDTSKCNGCGLCARGCKASCIDSKTHTIDYSRCVVCMDCLLNCHQGAIKYSHIRKIKSADERIGPTKDQIDSSRRLFMTGTGLLVAGIAVKAQEKKVDGGLAVILDKKVPKRKTRIVPPGAVSLRNLEQHCTACQLCVSVCPNDVLRPSTDILNLMQPESSYERGYCRPECTKCSEVCPAGAIIKISDADKSAIQIGHAVWIPGNCIPLTDGNECGNCARHCPVGAITMIESKNGPKIPAINTEICIGCGACENLCPARPFSAIYVEGHEVHRTI